jgi:hypothetical protein
MAVGESVAPAAHEKNFRSKGSRPAWLYELIKPERFATISLAFTLE